MTTLAEARALVTRARARLAAAHTDEGRYNAESALAAALRLVAKLEAAR